jgi:hypothetical protein
MNFLCVRRFERLERKPLNYSTPTEAPRVLTLDLASDKSAMSPLRTDAFNSNEFVTEKIMVPYADCEGKEAGTPDSLPAGVKCS